MRSCMVVELSGSSALRVTSEWAYQLSRLERYLCFLFTHGKNTFEGSFPRAFADP